MASTNKTTHYNLDQYISTDKPTYLTDFNNDMSAIDTGMYNAQTKADSAYTLAGSADGKADQAITNAGQAQTDASTALTRIGTLANLTTTEKTNVVGAVNELDGEIGDLTNLNTTAKNNLVAAINEVNTDSYSTTEEKTNKTWIDGKTIYRKVITGTLGTTGNTNVLTDLAIADNIVHMEGTFINTSNGDIRTLPFVIYLTGNTYYISCFVTKDTQYYKLNFWYSTQYAEEDYRIIIEYTK